MSIAELLERLKDARISLAVEGESLIVRADKGLITEELRSSLQENKKELIAILKTGRLTSQNAIGEVSIAPPAIQSDSTVITPEMLPLIELTQEEIDEIVDRVPGGIPNIQDIYALSPLQDGILFHHLMASEGDPYVISNEMAFTERGLLDRFLSAVQQVVDRHDILRTAFLWQGLFQPAQVVWRQAQLSVTELKLDPRQGPIAEQLLQRFDPRRHRFDLSRPPLLRYLIAHDPDHNRWVLLQSLHHLVGDHSTLDVLRAEVRTILTRQGHTLAAPQPFRNLVAQARLGVSREEHESFFRQMLGDVTEPTLPFGLSDVYQNGGDITESRRILPQTLNDRLRAQARRIGVSLASLCHLAWGLVLARSGGSEPVVLGTVLLGRMQAGEGASTAAGLFINTLPLRLDLDGRGTETAVRQAHANMAELLVHEHASLALAQRCSGVALPSPLFSAILNYRHNPVDATLPVMGENTNSLAGIEFLRGNERTNYPLTMSVEDFGQSLGLTARVVQPLSPERMWSYMQQALESVVEALETAPQIPVRQLEILPPEERTLVLEQWNATEAEYPEDMCIHELFEEQVRRTPKATALVYEEQSLSYEELNQQANQLGHYLIGLGVKPDERVGICVERGVGMVVGLLGILKAGGAYVPLDPAYPAERLAYMLEESAPVVLLTDQKVRGSLPVISESMTVLNLGDAAMWSSQPETNLERARVGLALHHLAYVIYTSGSTGKPKGVMIEHRNLANYLRWSDREYYQPQGDGSPAVHSIGFDGLVTTLFGPLLAGQTLTLLPQGLEMEHLAELCSGGDVMYTLVKVTPSHLRLLNQMIAADAKRAATMTLMIGGEALIPADILFWQRRFPQVRLVNHFGPTEITVGCCTFEIRTAVNETRSIPIGRPIANTRIYILDQHWQPVPVGVVGELYVSGAGVGRGYLNREELTAERFLRDPFGSAGARMYKTGDLGRWLADGTIEFLGRNDDQVKIRGFRIELGEIEARLAECAGVQEAVVMAREQGGSGEKRLVAYYTTSTTDVLEAEQLRAHLAAKLPEYMVPAAYVRLEKLPLTNNGKLDRKGLPEPEGDAYARRGYEEPQGETESKLAAIWAEVLKLERVGRQDNFFELGGHSLLVITLIERMRRKGLQADMRAVFAAPTLVELAASVSSEVRLVEVPANRIPASCDAITPEMLPLVDLTVEEIERIVSRVPGGAPNVQDIYPLAPLQEGMLFHYLMGEEGDVYLNSRLESFSTRSHLDSYLSAIQAVINRHDILRTAVMWEGLHEPVQVVCKNVVLPLTEVVLEFGTENVAEQLRSRFDPRSNRLDISQAPMLRLIVTHDRIRERWLLQWWYSHLLGDHVTIEVMREELQAHLLGQEGQLPAPLPFRNLVAQARLGVSREEHEAFFRKMLGDVEESTAPFGLLDVQGDGSGIEEEQMLLDSGLANRIRERARKLGVSPATLCHVAWAQVLAKISGHEDVVFGTIVFGRMQGQGVGRVMGPFINTLPVRIRVRGEGAEASVRRVHEQLADLMRHEHASLALAQRCSRVPAPSPLFTSLLNYRHNRRVGEVSSPQKLRAWEGMKVLRVEQRTNYPLTFSVDDLGQGFMLTTQTEAWVDPKRVCEYMSRALESLTGVLETELGAVLSRLEVLPERELRQVLYEWNDTAVKYASEKCIHELFEEQVRRTPEATAVVFEEQEVSYGELNRRANQLAHYLQKQGVAPDARVGICVERGVEMIVGLLAVLKAGGGYVPLDPAYPAERLKYMLQDSAPVVLLTQKHLRERLGGMEGMDGAVGVIDIEEDQEEWSREPESNPERSSIGPRPEHLAYVIYTSGSTGSPKGVMVEHRNVTRLFTATSPWFEFGANDIWTLFHSYGFDFSVWEMWGALIYGGRLIVVPKHLTRSPEDFYKLICQKKVTVLNQTPSAFRQLVMAQKAANQEHQLRYVIFGGEALEVSTLRPWYEQNQDGRTQLVNMYGITETTVHVTYRALQQADSQRTGWSPIGCRIPDLRTYILDGEREPVPVGVVGELFIGGAGVARGYLNQLELTAERFVKDRFAGDMEARMYRTGDLGRWLADGSIEFIGRNDFQVKIRGHRIELGEIEARLAEHEQVREAVVVAREDGNGGKRLVAYVVAESEPDAGELAGRLRLYLASRLPEYMVPAAFVRLEAMPLTPNGKLDRKALSAPEGEAYAQRTYKPPQTELEQTLANIWQELLGVERIGRHDHFFELGGHSILVIQLIEQLRRKNLYIEISTLFTKPVLRELAAALVQHRDAPIPPCAIHPDSTSITPEMLPLINLTQQDINRIIEQVPGGVANIQDIYALTPLQDGILFHHMLAREGDPYILCTHGTFADRELLDRYLSAIQQITDRHDILRTSFLWKGLSQPAQVVWRRARLSVTEVELDEQKGAYAEQLAQLFDPHRHRIDLGQAPLLRFIIAREPGASRWLALRIGHHLIEDALSVQVLRAEVSAIWEGQAHTLAIPQPFRNFLAQAQSGVSQEEQERFFRQMLGDVTEPTLPFGLSNVHQDGVQNIELRRMLPQALNDRLRVQVRRLGVSLANLCHLAWGQVLARCSGVEQVVFGTVLSGRMQGGEGINNAVGFFMNTLPLRLDLDDTGTETTVRRVHASLAELFRYENASLRLALRCSGVAAPTPLFSSTLNYRNYSTTPAPESRTENIFAGMEFRTGERHSNYPVAISFDDLGHSLITHLDVVQTVSAERVYGYFQQCLESLTHVLETDPQMPVRQLEILPREERQQLLEQWNATEAEYAEEMCIHELFEEQVRRTPEATALVYEEQLLSYEELNQQANRLAHYLIGLGVKPDERVGICVERGLGMVIGLLGILKAGGAYVPLDPGYPSERLGQILVDAAPKIMLSDGAGRKTLGTELPAELTVVDLDQLGKEGVQAPEWGKQPDSNPDPQVLGLNSRHLAYVIYTSGSTGIPKGVMNEHHALINRLLWMQRAYGLDATDVVLQKTSLSFDVSVWEFFWTLLQGAVLAIAPPDAHKDPTQLIELIQKQAVTTVHFVPSMLAIFVNTIGVEGCTSLRRLMCSGEALPAAQVQAYQSKVPGSELNNLYGPTEAAIDVTAWSCPRNYTGMIVPIGRPIANTQIYVLDGQRQPVPLGAVGEIYIGGVGVARGYLNRVEMTAERFVPNPFHVGAGGRMYKTGDLGRYWPDGNIEFLGRNDHQVKIRGYRIELGEIEARLLEHGLAKEAVVVAREEGGEKRLVAYVVAAEPMAETDAANVAGKLRAYLSGCLPEYMVPAAFVQLEKLPLTPNGKLDRKALPAPEGEAYAHREYEEPQGETESKLAAIWAELLKLERVGRHDSFFELGGHSLSGVRLLARISKVFGVELPITVLFARPKLEQLTEAVKQARGAGEQALLPMTPISRLEPIPLSYAQQRLWFLQQLEPESVAYNMPFGVRLSGELNHQVLTRSLNELVRRHEVLRTNFVVNESDPVQVIAAELEIKPQHIDLRGMTEAEREVEALRLGREEAAQPFDLGRGPLVRVKLLRLGEQEHVLLVTMHHIVSDGWSSGIMVREFGQLYQAYAQGKESLLPELKIQYADYAVWQRHWLRGEVLEEQLQYWRKQLGEVGPLDLPTDHPRPAVMSQRGAAKYFVLPAELAGKLMELTHSEGMTLFMSLLAAFQVMLSKYAGQQDIAVGTVVANRKRVEIEDLIGFFVNTLVVRTELRGNPSFAEVLRRVRQVTLDAYQHQDVPFEKLVEELQPERDLSRSPLFQVMVMLQNNEHQELQMPGLRLSRFDLPSNAAKFDLQLVLDQRGEELSGQISYALDVYEGGTVERMVEHLRMVLEEMVAEPKRRIGDVSVLTGVEREQVLEEWNATEAEYPQRCVQELFEEQVAKTPEAVAVEFEGRQMNYEELNQRANQLGHYLRRQGVGPEVKVAVCVERSLEMVVALLGVLKSGGAYVPLELKHPAERLKYMLEDSQAAVLLTRQEMLDRLPEFGGTVVRLDGQEEEISCQISENPTLLSTSESLMYVVYTSGSTGKPKGVAGTHRSMVNRLTWMQRTFPVTEDELCCQKTSLSFIDAVAEIFGPLVCGAPLLIIAESVVNDAKGLVDLLAWRRITRIVLVPSLLRAMLADEPRLGHLLDKLRLVVTSGEALEAELANLFESAMPDARLLNFYGSSEVAADATWCMVSRRKASDPILIGQPLDNVRAFVLNDDLEPLPVDMAGELYIGGAGLARGYLNRADLTAEKFVPDCFSGLEGERLYRTGDRARWQASGQLEFLGRRDHQVKVRGYRIELEEIEVMLLGHQDVEQAVVALDREQRLVGYVVKRSGVGELTVEQLRSYLQERLPGYMVPGAFVIVDRLPLTTSGKVDRKALPEPQWVSLKGEREVASTAEEEILCGIFCDVLKQARVGINNNFFEIGGHSLLATQVVSRVRTAFGVELPLRALFEAPTAAGLAERVRNLRGAGPVAAPIVRVARKGDLPLSFAQQRLWFLDQLHPNSSAYNIPYTMRMKGVLKVDATREALSEIVKRHEVLRTIFMQTQEGPVQRVQRGTEFRLEVEDLCGIALEEREAEMLHRVQAEADRPFDLEHGPVLRARILQLEKEDHVLQVVMHHIVTDGWSQHILLREFAGLYAAFAMGQPSPLAEMKLQYGDFAVWQRQWLKGEVLAEQVKYWKKELHGMHALDLPVDSRRTGVGQSVGRVPFLITAESMQKIKQLSTSHHATVFMVLTAAFHLLLGWYADQEVVVTGTDVANRNRKEVESMIGFFVNQLVLRTDLSGDPAFSELLQRVRIAALGAYTHQDVPFEKVVEELAPARVGAQLPLFNVKMIMLNTPEALQISLPGLQIEAIPVAVSVPRYLLAFTLWERAGALHGGLDYSQEMFRESSIELFLLLFRKILDLAVANPSIRLNAIREQLHRLKESHQQQRKVSLQDELERRFSSVKRVKVAVN